MNESKWIISRAPVSGFSLVTLYVRDGVMVQNFRALFNERLPFHGWRLRKVKIRLLRRAVGQNWNVGDSTGLSKAS